MDNNRVLVFSPHADDATIFVGGMLADMAKKGREIYIVRVTNDDFDACGMDAAEAMRRNCTEAEQAYASLGAHQTIHLGFRSDYMMMNDYGALREKIVELIRRIRPYTVFTFDLNMPGESNMDHDIIGKAVHEALWIASFDLHYPEQLKSGLDVWSVPETVLFSTCPGEGYTGYDISDTLDIKTRALLCHRTPIENMFRHALLSARCAGKDTAHLQALLGADRETTVRELAKKLAALNGSPFGLSAAETVKICPYSAGIFGDDADV